MKPLIIIAALATAAFAAPATKVTNRQFDDGSGSSKVMDPVKRQSVETVYANGRVAYKIVYTLDERLQPLSGVYYNAAGRVFQKSAYKLDGVDRIVQEVVYTAQGKLVCTKNYIYGTRAGKDSVVGIDTYDSNGNLIRPPAKGGKRR
jgi:hypothetical protein